MFIKNLISVIVATLSSASQHPNYQKRAPYRVPALELVSNKYIVKLSPDHTLDAHWQHIGLEFSKEQHSFQHFESINAYAVVADERSIHDVVRLDPGVQYVEHVHLIEPPDDNVTEILDFMDDSGLTKRMAGAFDKLHSTNNVPYGPAQISNQNGLPVPVRDLAHRMTYLKDAGAGVHIYILDSGITRLDNPLWNNHYEETDFMDFFGDGTRQDGVGNGGHGTKVASLAGLPEISFAPGARIFNFKISDGRTTESTHVIAAIEEVIKQHRANREQANANRLWWRGSVINYSWGSYRDATEKDSAMEAVIATAAVEGVVFVAAAGNKGTNSVQSYPCNYEGTICVGSTDHQYRPAEHSNWGTAVDIWAPGFEVTVMTSLQKRALVTGTSFASPTVAGLAAMFLSIEYMVGDGQDHGEGLRVCDQVLRRLRENKVQNVVVPEHPNNELPDLEPSPRDFAGSGVWAPNSFYVNAPPRILLPAGPHVAGLPKRDGENVGDAADLARSGMEILNEGHSIAQPNATVDSGTISAGVTSPSLIARDDPVERTLPTEVITTFITRDDGLNLDWTPETTQTELGLDAKPSSRPVTCAASLRLSVASEEDYLDPTSNGIPANLVLRNEFDDERGRFDQSVKVGSTIETGGLGPLLSWTIVSHTGDDRAWDVNFNYDDEKPWSWLRDCDEISYEVNPLGYVEERLCVFTCAN